MTDTPLSSKIVVARLAGRCANGAERDGGRKYHALEGYSEFGKAMCGAEPGRTSGGWATPYGDSKVTCPKCLRKLEKVTTEAAKSKAFFKALEESDPW